MSTTSLNPEFLEGLQQAFAKVSYEDVGAITSDRPIAELGLDSVRMAELLIILEEQLDVALEQSDLEKVKTFGDLQEAVNRARASA